MTNALQEIACAPAFRDDPIPAVRCAPNGGPCLDGAKSYEKWYVGGFYGPNNSFPTSIAPNETQVLVLKASAQDNNAGNLNLSQFLGIFTSKFAAVQLYSTWLDRKFSNGPVPVELLFGTPNFPANMLGTLYVKAGTGIQAAVTNLDPASNSVSLLGRGFRNLIQQGRESDAQRQELAYWHRMRSFLPYNLVPDQGPSVPAPGTTALANGASVTMTYTCPSEGDFYMMANYLLVMEGSAQTEQLTVTDWSEGGAAGGFIERTLLPIRADLIFSSSFGIQGAPDGFLRASGIPGGWGGDPWCGEGQWVHRLHRGTQMSLTIRNDSGVPIRICPVFSGYLATCEAAPGEFLAFPMSQGQIARPMQPVMPGDPRGQCPPGAAPPPPPMVRGVPCPPPRGFPPSRQQLYRGGQTF